jgi:hypothetical protein
MSIFTDLGFLGRPTAVSPMINIKPVAFPRSTPRQVSGRLLTVDPSDKLGFRLPSRPEIRRNLIDNLTVGDLVTVANEVLAAVVSRYNARVELLANDVSVWTLQHDRPEIDRTVIGWGDGSSHSWTWSDCVSVPWLLMSAPERW